MSEFKGTKGKWKIEDTKSPFETTINSSEYRIAEVKHFEGKNFNDPIEKEAKANALLISKSPLLLKAIKDSINELREVGLNDMANYHEKLYNECVNL